MNIGVIKEGKNPPDKRVPLTPTQCKSVENNFPNVRVYIQSSDIRAISDQEYRDAGLEIVEDVSFCDVLFGVKEVPIDQLIPNKTYFFFSHTIKEQPYNRDLLKAVVDKNIRLIDYETLTNNKGVRMIGFGRYAGIVGCYNGFRAYGLKNNSFQLKSAHSCHDRKEMEGELSKIQLPNSFKMVLTGLGRVAKGAIEILDQLNIEKVSAEDIVNRVYDNPVYAQLNVEDYNERIDGTEFSRFEFYKDPKDYRSTFPRFLKHIDMYVACHYWNADSPFLFTRDDLKSDDINIEIVADISCDIDGPVASTIRPSTIEDPLYGYNPKTEEEIDFKNSNAIGVMAVDNLPCELPRDASEDFGQELINKILPALLGNDPDDVIQRATITNNGTLTSNFQYLKDYLEGR